jgi:hypothetical protein
MNNSGIINHLYEMNVNLKMLYELNVNFEETVHIIRLGALVAMCSDILARTGELYNTSRVCLLG